MRLRPLFLHVGLILFLSAFLFSGIVLLHYFRTKTEIIKVETTKVETTKVKGECCFRHETSGCSDIACETIVCQIDPFCCGDHKGKWDKSCVEITTLLCGSNGNDYCPELISLFAADDEWQSCGSVPGTNVNIFIKDKEFCQANRHIKIRSFDSEECPLFDVGDCVCLEWNLLMDIWPILVKGIEQKAVVSNIVMDSLSDNYLSNWAFGVDGNKDGIITVEDAPVIENIVQKKCQ